jgi:hypothetical protein
MHAALIGVVALVVALALWGLIESQWVQLGTLELQLDGLPPGLDGFRILHLSDPHFGALSLGWVGANRAAGWAEQREVDLTVITGDLLSARRGRSQLERFVARLEARHDMLAILGNHDVATTRDPFSRPGQVQHAEIAGMRLLRDEAVELEHAGCTVRIAGLDAESYLERRVEIASLAGDDGFEILLTHYPTAVDRVRPGTFDLVLAGHMHGGQICVPLPGAKVRLAHPHARYPEGTFRLGDGATTLVVSRGLGTTFVPFRFFARPEATELILRAPTLEA